MTLNTNHTTPAALYGRVDALLSPTPAHAPEPPAVHPGATSLVDDLAEIARRSQPQPRRMTAPDPEPTSLYEASDWDPMPMESDPLGLKERMDELEAALAARSGPRQAAPVHPQADARAVRLTEAHRRIDAILG